MLHLQIIYDGEGTIVKWVVITEGTLLTYDLVQEFDIDVLLLKSNSGGLSSVALKNAMITII